MDDKEYRELIENDKLTDDEMEGFEGLLYEIQRVEIAIKGLKLMAIIVPLLAMLLLKEYPLQAALNSFACVSILYVLANLYFRLLKSIDDKCIREASERHTTESKDQEQRKGLTFISLS